MKHQPVEVALVVGFEIEFSLGFICVLHDELVQEFYLLFIKDLEVEHVHVSFEVSSDLSQHHFEFDIVADGVVVDQFGIFPEGFNRLLFLCKALHVRVLDDRSDLT